MQHVSQESASRVLVYRLGSIGDFVIALPCLHLVRRRFPRAEIRLLTNLPVDARTTPAMSVLEGTGLVDEFVDYEAGTRDPQELWRLARSIRSFAPDLLIYLASPRRPWTVYRDYLFFRWCGIRRMIGVPFARDLRMPRPPRDPAGIFEREAERLARCLASFGHADVDRQEGWDLRLSPQESAEVDRRLRAAGADGRDGPPLLGLSMGTKQEIKDWGESNWRETISALRPLGFGLVLVGGAEDRERSERLTRDWPQPVINFCGQLSPRLSAAALRRTILCICHDSGPMHLAAAVGTPCVAIFSKLSVPGKWYPFGNGHKVLYPPPSADSIAAITPRQVIEAVTQALAELRPGRSPQRAGIRER